MRLNSRTIMRLLPALLAGMLLSACRGEDNSPHSVAGFKEYEILGIDVSAHNGDIDFEKVSKGGIEFVIIKATEGGTFKDRMFVDNVRKARKPVSRSGLTTFSASTRRDIYRVSISPIRSTDAISICRP